MLKFTLKSVSLYLLTGAGYFLPACQTPGHSQLIVPADVDLVINEDDEVGENPSNYVGKKVFVKGKVDELLSDNAFLLDYDGLIGLSRILVIASQESKETPVVKNKQIEVTGQVTLFNREEMQRQLGRNLDPRLFAKYQNHPVVVVDSLLSH